jgi:hypothetical protein
VVDEHEGGGVTGGGGLGEEVVSMSVRAQCHDIISIPKHRTHTENTHTA